MTSIDEMEIKEKIEKIQNLTYDKALNLIYEWVRTKIITRKQFKVLIQANRDSYI